jgi:hypothetical protein
MLKFNQFSFKFRRNFLFNFRSSPHVKWAPCHHDSMACPQIADGGDAVRVWRVAVNILNKQSRTADNGWSSSLGLGMGLTTPHRKKNKRQKKTKGV